VTEIRHWLFDLDDTLYPASAGLFALVSKRITGRIGELLGLPFEEARAVQRAYWKRYGTSLRGLMVEHGVDPEPFLAHVHDVPIEQHITPDPALRAMLASLPGTRHVFTNGPSEFVDRVLMRLGVDDLFDRRFDIRHAGFVPKPNPEPFDRVSAALGAEPESVVLIDDSPQNLVPARARGWWTVWLRSPHSLAGGQAGGSVALAGEATARAGEDAPHVTIDALLDLPQAWSETRAGAWPPSSAPAATPPRESGSTR
jgi:putative hydrolase of the HAD superfamily